MEGDGHSALAQAGVRRRGVALVRIGDRVPREGTGILAHRRTAISVLREGLVDAGICRDRPIDG
jgi:hypothetical protein